MTLLDFVSRPGWNCVALARRIRERGGTTSALQIWRIAERIEPCPERLVTWIAWATDGLVGARDLGVRRTWRRAELDDLGDRAVKGRLIAARAAGDVDLAALRWGLIGILRDARERRTDDPCEYTHRALAAWLCGLYRALWERAGGQAAMRRRREALGPRCGASVGPVGVAGLMGRCA